MQTFDPVHLARIQFAANMTFHILFPTISIAMGWVLLFFKTRFVATGQPHWMDAYQFWVKIFALTFALGVVSGITMSFQFGTNWPGFMTTVGNVAGPLLAYEVLTAFFLEATMLGIMLFGRGRVSERVHTWATFLVAAGTTASAFWILALNSWMHTPAGFEMINGQAHVTSWFKVIFNPSFPYRFSHMLLASGLTVAFLLAGISAFRWLKQDRGADVNAGLRTGIYIAALLIPIQIVVGDLHGVNTLHHQPAKIAAMEGIWETQRGAPAVLFAWPDAATQSNQLELAIPKLASLYLTHDWNGEVKGIKEFGDQHPPVAPVFWAFRTMVGVGLLMLAVSWFSVWQTRRQRSIQPWLARVLVAMTFAGWVALISGWYTTEIGRQPWLVQGVLTAAQAASNVPASNIALTLVMYLTLYVTLFFSYIKVVFYLAKKATLKEGGVYTGGVADAEPAVQGVQHA
ncbi:MAG: cytochrome ubiquinol oxidase subunit I [Rhodoferax sp.]|uniref:cytochrome ubiquinol oxidase subunit I n=1 Tax=Rhodoferax sp. TaxID=50421 RepID=UPI001797D340|nr:cytochrome ubiquinol oxidase subunit I [Rhodoferax sp.]NMM12010.1 cytochrome ubiquinol oxidase subunit I [Rhodoferax sp.]NMM19953.1 cytochrome ubiquinol oxidase subunit I [Rhodoferax sp.]